MAKGKDFPICMQIVWRIKNQGLIDNKIKVQKQMIYTWWYQTIHCYFMLTQYVVNLWKKQPQVFTINTKHNQKYRTQLAD